MAIINVFAYLIIIIYLLLLSVIAYINNIKGIVQPKR